MMAMRGGVKRWFLLLVMRAFLMRGSTTAYVLETTCFYQNNNGFHAVTGGTGGPCGIVTPDTGFFSCCSTGDICLQDDICGWGRPVTGNSSGFYVGGCTDATLKDSTCSPACNDQARQDAVYNSTEGLWACCGVDADGDVTCNDPLKEFFAAPAPASMSSTFSVGALITAAASSSTSTSTFSTVQTTSSGAITTTSPATRKEASQTTAVPQIAATSQVTSSPTSLAVHTQKGLSTGAIAGIGIGCAIAGIAIIGSIIFLLKRCYRKTASNQDQILGDHRRNQRPIVSDQKSSAVTCANPSYRPTEMSLPSVYEGETRRQSKPRELEGAEYASEMGGSEQWSARERVVELP